MRGDCHLTGLGWVVGFRHAIDHQDNVKACIILNTLIDIMKPPAPIIMFRSSGFSSFLSRRLDLFRKVAFSTGFKRPVPKDVKAMYKLPHPNATFVGA